MPVEKICINTCNFAIITAIARNVPKWRNNQWRLMINPNQVVACPDTVRTLYKEACLCHGKTFRLKYAPTNCGIQGMYHAKKLAMKYVEIY